MNPHFLALIVLVVLSAVVFVVSSERAFTLEKQRFFNFANPLYVFDVLAAFASMAIGSYGLIELHKLAVRELDA